MREFISSRMIADAYLAAPRDLLRRPSAGFSGELSVTFCDRPQSIRELSRRSATFHHFPGVGVERIIDDPLSGVESMVVLVAEMPEAFGHRLQSGSLGLMVKGI